MALEHLIGQILDEKYRIDKQLGQGGMGAVYLATHIGTERPVALKVIAPQFMRNDEFVERFRREAKAAGRLRHPNVVDVTDFGFTRASQESIAYLVMEYLDGCTLAEVLAEESHLPLGWVVDILEQVCSAVDEAHQQGVIHRDLKPDNIWLEPNRRGGYSVKVLDFGLAKLADPSLPDGAAETGQQSQAITSDKATSSFSSPARTAGSDTVRQIGLSTIAEQEETRLMDQPDTAVARDGRPVERASVADHPELYEAATRLQPAATTTEDEETRLLADSTRDNRGAIQTATTEGLTRVGSILGTPAYMSPEQCRGEALDARSDIYSLGVIAYKMLAGVTPFSGDMSTIIRLHLEAEPPPLRDKNPKVPKKVADLVMTALSKNPSERPHSAAGFASALRATSDGLGVLLRRAFALYIEHFPKFFRVSLLAQLPIIALTALQIVNDVLKSRGMLSQFTGTATAIVLGLSSAVANFLAASIITGLTIRMVTQLYLAPLRPIQLRLAFAALKKRLKWLVLTGMLATCLSLLGFILLVIPGVIMFMNYTLYGAVVMMENLKGYTALKRSKSLVKRARFTVAMTLLIQWSIPILISSIMALVIAILLKGMKVENAPDLTSRITGTMTVFLNIVFVPLISTLTALLYLKTRQIGGETLKEALSLFEEEDAPRTRWQHRMRDRISSQTISRDSRKTPSNTL
jgi:serine/threonine protein kinase